MHTRDILVEEKKVMFDKSLDLKNENQNKGASKKVRAGRSAGHRNVSFLDLILKGIYRFGKFLSTFDILRESRKKNADLKTFCFGRTDGRPVGQI